MTPPPPLHTHIPIFLWVMDSRDMVCRIRCNPSASILFGTVGVQSGTPCSASYLVQWDRMDSRDMACSLEKSQCTLFGTVG